MKSKFNLSKVDLEEKYREQGLSTKDIARIYQCNTGTIWYWLHKFGIGTRNNREASLVGPYKFGKKMSLPLEEIIHLYQEMRMPLKLIGKKYNCSWWTISDRLKKVGITIRPREEALTDFGRDILNSPENRAKQSAGQRNLWASDPEFRQRQSVRMKEGRNKPSVRAKMSAALRKRWADPQKRNELARCAMRGQKRKPNNPECAVLDVLDRYFPTQWRYTGDGSVILGGLNPDFLNVNGRKLIIEVFGDYWHTKKVRRYHETEQGRVEAYRKYGFDTLVIWERETKCEGTILKKVKGFISLTGSRRV